MVDIDFTQEDVRRLLDYINSDTRTPLEPETARKFTILRDAYGRKVARDLERAAAECARYRKKIEALEARRRTALMQGEYASLNFTAEEIAWALICEMAETSGEARMTSETLQHLMFMAYSGWLSHYGERICIDRPVCAGRTNADGTRTVLGPWFWSAAKKTDLKAAQTARTMRDSLAQRHPGLARYLRNVARKYGPIRESDLGRHINASEAVRNALPERNGGRWNGTIEDSDIYLWREAENGRQEAKSKKQ